MGKIKLRPSTRAGSTRKSRLQDEIARLDEGLLDAAQAVRNAEGEIDRLKRKASWRDLIKTDIELAKRKQRGR